MKLSGIVYVKINANRFRIKMTENHSREIEVLAAEPFTSERLIVGDFERAAKYFKEGLKKAYGNRLISPIIVIQPLEKVEGGLSQVEKRILKELGKSAGARQVWVWDGPELSDAEILKKIENRTFA